MEEFLDTYFNYKILKRNLKKNIWDYSFDFINRKYEEAGGDQPLTYLFALFCTFLTCLFYSIPYILENIVIGRRTDEIYATPEELAKRKLKIEMLDKGIGYNKEILEYKNTVSIQTKKQQAINVITEALKKNNLILQGILLNTSFPKISEEELISFVNTGVINKPLIVQRVTFGNDINKAIKILFNSSVKHRKIRNEKSTYLVFETETIEGLERKVQELFLNERIKIKITNP